MSTELTSEIETVWKRLDLWLYQNAVPIYEGFRPGAAKVQVEVVQNALGVRFPDDVCATYLRHDGQEGRSPQWAGGMLLPGGGWLSLLQMLLEWRSLAKLLADGAFDRDALSKRGYRADPEPGIRNEWWNPKWIPIAHDGSGNFHCVDLSPAEGGAVGQIITVERDAGERRCIAGSFTEYLSNLVDYLLGGERTIPKKTAESSRQKMCKSETAQGSSNSRQKL